MTLDIVEWAESKFGFYVDRTWDNNRWAQGKRPVILSPHHRDILRHCFTPGADGRMPYDTIAICESAKSGKSMLGGLIAEYFALHIEAPSEIYLVANKKDQAAGKMFKSLTDSIDYNPYLPNVDPNRYNVTFSNGSEIKAIPSNAKTEAGGRYSLAVFDEPWGIQTELEEAVVSEFKVDPTRNISVRLFIGYGGFEDSTIWREMLESGRDKGKPVLDHIVNDDGRPACYALGRMFVYHSDHPRQPWQTADWLESFRRIERLTQSQEERMVFCRFVAATQQFIEPLWWQACYDPRIRPLQPGDRMSLIVAIDLAKGVEGGDHCALVAMAKLREDETCVKYVQVWQPPKEGPFDYEKTVGVTLSHLIENYHVAEVCYDEYQALSFIKPYRAKVFCRPFSQQSERDESDSKLYQDIVGRKIRHYDDPTLNDHVYNTMAKYNGTKLRLVKRNSQKKIDAAICLSMANARAMYLNLDFDPAHNEPDTRKKTRDELIEDRLRDEAVYQMWKQSKNRKNGAPEPPPVNGATNSVRIIYQGNMSPGSFVLNTTAGPQAPVKNHVYEVTKEVFENLQATYPYSWFLRVG